MKAIPFLILIFLSSISCSHNTLIKAEEILPRKSFIYVQKTLAVKRCSGEGCSVNKFHSSGSGFVVKKTSRGVYGVTAGHVCHDPSPEELVGPAPKSENKIKTELDSSYMMVTIDGRSYRADILTYTMPTDLCMFFVHGLTKDVVPVVIAETPPVEGEKVYNIAAPRGIFERNMAPILEGRFSGNASRYAHYSIPAAPGSSGSMIINGDGHLVGMIHSVFIKFDVLILSPKYQEIKLFIESNLLKYETYRKSIDLLGLEVVSNNVLKGFYN